METGRAVISNGAEEQAWIEIHYDIDNTTETQKELLREHHKIRINLNQIARHLNSGGAATEELREEIRTASTAIRPPLKWNAMN